MNRHTHRIASAAVALVATILFVAPVWAAKPAGDGSDGAGNGNSGGNGGGNQGSVRVVDVASGLETLTNNEPHVCTFLLAFDGAPDGESGDWSIVDWPPTGNGAQVASGVYAFPAGGTFTTGTFELDAGHYRVVWQAINAQTEKHKTFWVDDSCVGDDPEDQPEEQPQDQPEEQPEEQPPQDQPEEQPPQDQPEEQDQELSQDPPGEPEDEPGEGDVNGAVGEPPAPGEEPAADEQPVDEPDPDGDVAASVVGDPIVSELPDTAMPMPVLPGLGAALGLLCLVAAHLTLLHRGIRALR